jgi:hypothetical protein
LGLKKISLPPILSHQWGLNTLDTSRRVGACTMVAAVLGKIVTNFSADFPQFLQCYVE